MNEWAKQNFFLQAPEKILQSENIVISPDKKQQ